VGIPAFSGYICRMSDTYHIAGIQQVGIGVPNVQEAFKWYRRNFGMDIPIFEEAAEANLMLPYTGGKPHKRHAILAINLKGGGGFEIWQYTSRTPQPPTFQANLGDLGLFVAKIKSEDVQASCNYLKSQGATLLSEVMKAPDGELHFFMKDPYGNIFEIVEGKDWFGKGLKTTGGPVGMIIGVSNIERSKKFYAEVLGYDKVIYDKEGEFDDLKSLPGGTAKCRRILLTHSKPRTASFAEMFGSSYIELVQVYNYTPRKIFEGRFWGDLGFIHLCFDIRNMAALKTACEKAGHPFTVDGGAGFEMGEAAGHFTYIEDPDGALIEFVETKKIPILKKFGWYLDLRKRPADKPVPAWMLRTLKMNRVKD
jgi:catechol 2,3-dioxygenase-like lactoylglutathione lyase family enzyme